MKKFSAIVVVFICIISLFLAGCSKADNATLVSISDKYSYIAGKYDELFLGNRFIIDYNSDNLSNLINSSNENYNVLKTDDSLEDYTSRGAYGILMEGVNSTYLNSNASSVLANNEKTEKKYKKAMYLSLEDLQKNAKKLDTSKTSLESVFNNDQRDAELVAEQELTKYNLNEYIKNLNACLSNLYDFNKNYNLALNYNIIKPVSLNDLLYGLNTTTTVSNVNITMLVNNANLLISNFVLNYSINLKGDILDSRDLLNSMAKILTEKSGLTTDDKINALDGYKIIRTFEDGLIKSETAFINAYKTLNKDSFLNPNETEIKAIENIENYKKELSSYVNKLIVFLQNLT